MSDAAFFISLAREQKKYIDLFYAGKSSSFGRPLDLMQAHKRNGLYVLTLESTRDLCRFFRIDFTQLEKHINYPEYFYFQRPKKRGGHRDIFAPASALRQSQRRLNYFLQAYYLLIKPDPVTGFVINPHYLGRTTNIVANAFSHVNKRNVLNIDLKDFFHSISAKRVFQLFESEYFMLKRPIAVALALLTTYQQKLPVGAPTSPVISNFICLPLDAELERFCEVNDLSYTRYADDLTFSSHVEITTNEILDIINIIKGHGFRINEQKLRLKPSNRKQTVTGVVVNKRLNVDRKLLKKIRAMLFDLSTNGLAEACRHHFKLESPADKAHQQRFLNRLRGYINFVGQVRGNTDIYYKKYLDAYRSIIPKF